MNIEDRTEQLAEVHGKVFAERMKPRPPSRVIPSTPVTLDDQRIIDLITARPKWARLWSGDTSAYHSQSEADLALCGRVAFFTGPDPARIDSIFRQSALTRDKWDRADYREATIGTALEDKVEFYNPSARRPRGRRCRYRRPV